MNIENVLNRIKDRTQKNRDLLIDDISIAFEGNLFSKEDKEIIIVKTLKILKTEEDLSVVESILNLHGLAFFDDICTNQISHTCAELLPQLKAGSLVHALPK
jgi:hypothetical protein